MQPEAGLPQALEEWLQLLEKRHAVEIRLGLDRISVPYAKMGGRPDAAVFLVAGTNGKGSVCALLEAILLAGGYRVGCYTSPHLLHFNERVRVNGKPVDDRLLVNALAAVEAAREETDLTYFEHVTLAALEIFRQAPLDALILEVGMGGRLDAVNLVDPDCAIVTSVDLDHQAFLGSDREMIGMEKAGIFRAGRPAVCADPAPPRSLLKHAEELNVSLWICGRDYGFIGQPQQWYYWRCKNLGECTEPVRRAGLAYPALRGKNQLWNAAAAMMALDVLCDRLPLSMQAIREGMMLVTLPGRFQVLPGRPVVVLDVAHNPQAAGVLAENLGAMGYFPETIAVFGMLADKDISGVVSAVREKIDLWFLSDLHGARGLTSRVLAATLVEMGIDKAKIRCFGTPSEAFGAARKTVEDNGRIVTFGSFLMVADVLSTLQA